MLRQIREWGKQILVSYWLRIDLKIFPIDTIDNIVETLEIIGWIYFPPIEYCTLLLMDSNHLSLLAARQEEGGGTFLDSDDSPDSSFSSF